MITERMGSVSKNSFSRYATDTEQGSHTFEISGYSLKKGIGVGEFIQSSIFAAGGYDWVIPRLPRRSRRRCKGLRVGLSRDQKQEHGGAGTLGPQAD
jgi:hypothetical protein